MFAEHIEVTLTWQRKAIICDIDGTLADLEHRRKFVETTPKNWDKFFEPERVKQDKLIEPVRSVIQSLQRDNAIIFVSGRREDLRSVTIDWLRKHGLWMHPFILRMRKMDDRRADTLVKQEILAELQEDGWKPWLAVDDRNSVVAMWREQGLTCLQVAEGDF